MIAPALTFIAGIAVACAIMSAVGKTKEGVAAAGEGQCDGVAILLWERIDGDIESELADLGGGRLGVSHASIDLCEYDDEGHALMIECHPGTGVVRSRRDRYGSRRHATVILTGEDAAEVRGCVRAQIGRPFDPMGLLGGLINPDAMLCSTLTYRCLPARLRSIVDEARAEDAIGLAVSPAQLALAFGAVIGGEPVYVE
jgi:hypothetical protein